MALLIIITIIIITIEVPGLLQKQMWRELAVFSGILIVGIIYGIAHVLEIRIINPTNITNSIFIPLFETVNKLLK